MDLHYLDDLAAGQHFRGSNRLRIEADRIKTFAAEFDPQPFHLGEEAASASLFMGLAASGWHTAAATMRRAGHPTCPLDHEPNRRRTYEVLVGRQDRPEGFAGGALCAGLSNFSAWRLAPAATFAELNHFDLGKAQDFPIESANPPLPTWVDLVLRLSKSPVISIASIRGRTRGGGNEFSLACDLRYASAEKALFGQPEVGSGILPGGGGSEGLPRLVGRDRALEIILSSQDYGAHDAERFGMVTRALPDNELDPFVDALAARLSGFDKQALAGAKAQVNRATLPADTDFFNSYAEYSQSLAWPGFSARRPRMAKLAAKHGPAELELRLGHYIGLAN